jgi:hypothetical protein
MKILRLQRCEKWDPIAEEFYYVGCKGVLVLEHSLVSISKWEKKYKKPYLSKKTLKNITDEEFMYYIKCMTVNHPNPSIYESLTSSNLTEILQYCNDTNTATTINNKASSHGRQETMTSEVIYAYMVLLGIPFECQKWHINRLLTLISVVNIKQQKPQNMSKRSILSQNKSLNSARRKARGSKG